MQLHKPFQTKQCTAGHKYALTGCDAAQNADHNSGLQILCLEVERQLNRHYRRLLGFFSSAFTDRRDYPLSAAQALLLFCVNNGLRDMAQLCRTAEPVTGQAEIILAGLCVQGYISCAADGSAAAPADPMMTGNRGADNAGHHVQLTAKGQAVADRLHDLYNHVFMEYTGRNAPDAARLAAMHVSLARLQDYHDRQHHLA